jgi:type I restriction enzyme R subunit
MKYYVDLDTDDICDQLWQHSGNISGNSQLNSLPWGESDFYPRMRKPLDAHTTMSTQALESKQVQREIIKILLDHSSLYEDLRARASAV